MDFTVLLDESNSITNNATNEFTIIDPIIDKSTENLIISSPCKITSNCYTRIKCQKIQIKSPNVFLSNITLECSIELEGISNFFISNCYFNPTNKLECVFSIQQSSNISIDHVTISGSSEVGIFIYGGSDVKINNLTISGSANSLIGMRKNSSLIIQKSTLQNSPGDCIDVGLQCNVQVCECHFLNVEHSVLLVSDSTFSFKDSDVDNCGKNCIVISNAKDFLVEKNDFKNGKISCISINDSKGVIRDNTFTKFEGNGILCSQRSNIQILNNQFFNLSFPAIGVRTKSKSIVSGNKIIKNEVNGISVRDTSDVMIQDNVIDDIVECGISVSDSENVKVIHNQFTNCRVTAIESYNKSNVYVCENEISHISKYAFLAYTSGYIKAEKNDISDVKLAMAKINFKGSGEFIENKVNSCQIQCECQTSSPFLFDKNGSFEGVTNDRERANKLSIKFDEYLVDANISKFCLKCHSKPHNCFLVDCGHNVYCKECAEQALKKKEACPLCRWPIVDISVGFDTSNDDTCVICLTNKPNCIILPCGHMGVCADCIENWFKTKKCCPICRAEPCFHKEIVNNNI